MTRSTGVGRRSTITRRHYCTCGLVVIGNGARGNHGKIHERSGDGHRWVSAAEYAETIAGRAEVDDADGLLDDVSDDRWSRGGWSR